MAATPTVTLDKANYAVGQTMTATVTPQTGAATSYVASLAPIVGGVAGTAVPYTVDATSFTDTLGKVWTRTSAIGVSPATYTATA